MLFRSDAKGAKRVSIIVMNPQDGRIYAMVNAPEYDLNSPYSLTAEDGDTSGLDTLLTMCVKSEV